MDRAAQTVSLTAALTDSGLDVTNSLLLRHLVHTLHTQCPLVWRLGDRNGCAALLRDLEIQE